MCLEHESTGERLMVCLEHDKDTSLGNLGLEKAAYLIPRNLTETLPSIILKLHYTRTPCILFPSFIKLLSSITLHI